MQGMVYFMGVFFVLVATLKLADWRGFVHAFSMYDILAKRSKQYAWLYPLIELFLGVSYLLKWNIRGAAFVTLVLVIIGTIGVTKNLLSKNKVQCACLGTLIKIPLTKVTLIEDVVMGIMAIMLLVM
jgi:hypothetical protein